MDFIQQRYSDNGKSTQGVLLEKVSPKPVFFSFVLEDGHRDFKVPGETRIPAGFYELKILRVDTPLTIRHRESYNRGEVKPWFFFHIEITGIKNFSGVYYHSGISHTHTDGCPLLSDTSNNNQIEVGNTARSLQAVKRFYQKVYPVLDSGKKCFVEVRDEDFLVRNL